MKALPGRSALPAAIIFLVSMPFAIAQEEKPPGPELSYTAPMGARVFDVSKLAPYHAVWSRSIKPEEEWTSQGEAEEILEVDDDGNWVHTQITTVPGTDRVITVVRTLDGTTLRPLHTLRTDSAAPEGAPVQVEFTYGPIDVTGTYTFGDGSSEPYEKALPMPMFDGSIVGLPIATMPLAEGYRETIPTVIPSLNATYWLEIEVTGKMPYEVQTGEVIDVWEVTANWYNVDDEDWYPPGRDDWGGAYYIAVEPGNGVPYVVEYAHSTLVFAWDGKRRD